MGLSSSAVRTNEPATFNKVMVAPNPVSDVLNVAFDSKKDQNIRISLTDMTGRTVISTQKDAVQGVNAFQIPAAQLSAGIWMLRLENGQEVKTIKVVKN
jgi:hypothetical protein